MTADHTLRMTALLGRLRREMNGAVAESLDRALPPELRYGLDLGVSLPTIRSLARAEGRDHYFAKFLYRQDVRELRLAALWIAEPDRVTAEELPVWMQGRMPRELIEELAFALLSRSKVLPELIGWFDRTEAGYAYAAAMALARGAGYDRMAALAGVRRALTMRPDDRMTAQGAAVLLTVLATDQTLRPSVRRLVAELGDSPAERLLAEEMSWRLEV